MRALGLFDRWLRQANLSHSVRHEIHNQIRQNFEQAIAEARRAGAPGVARSIAWQAFRQIPTIITDSLYWRQVMHIALSPIRPDPLRVSGN